jgi:fatty acid desaturase
VPLPTLKYAADRRTLLFVGIYALLVLTGWLRQEELATWHVALLLALTCLWSFFQAVITHNTVHVPIFRERPWNRAFQYLISVTYGHPVSAFVRGHNLSHHLHTQTRKDVMRTTKARFRWNLLNQALFFFCVGPSINRANRAYCQRMKTERPEWYRQFRQEWYVVWSVMALLLLLDWQKFLIWFVLPHAYGAWGIIGINYLQHDGCDFESPWNHSRNFVGRFVNWFCFNNGFHGMHHIQPNMHWSLLPEAHRERLAPWIHPNLDQKSLFVYLWTAYLWPGRRVSFDGRPHEPEPVGEDEDWIPGRAETPEGVSLGAAEA